MNSLSVTAKQLQEERNQIEGCIRKKFEDKFFGGGEYDVRQALEGLHYVVLSNEKPRLALAAALYVLFTWIRSPHAPQYKKPLKLFLESLNSADDRSGHTVAFINGAEFISLQGMPIVDYDALYVPAVA